MKTYYTSIILGIIAYSNLLPAQEKDYSLAKVGVKVENIYIFIGSTPVQEYNTIDSWEVYWNKDGRFDEKVEEAVTRARKKYNNVDGIIFKAGANKAEFIKFIGREITGGGFKGGDKIQYKDGKTLQYGEISLLDNTKQKATIKYLNEYGDEKTDVVSYEKLTLMSKDEFQKVQEKQNAEIQKHKFTNNEKVTWVDGNKPRYGEILSLNNEKHDAKISYLDKYGDTKTETVDFLKVEKADELKYKEFMLAQDLEIQKHKFVINETVSFKDDKDLKVGEVTALNNANHKASVKFLNIYGEEKTIDLNYFDIEKISKEKFNEETAKFKLIIAKYKFIIGQKVIWTRQSLMKKSEIIQCEIISLDDQNHKALVKYTDKENKEIQAKADYLDLSSTN